MDQKKILQATLLQTSHFYEKSVIPKKIPPLLISQNSLLYRWVLLILGIF